MKVGANISDIVGVDGRDVLLPGDEDLLSQQVKLTSAPAAFTEAELDDPRVVELGRQMIEAVKKQMGNDRDQYRALLEARVAGLEALLTAIVQQMPHYDDHLSIPLRDNLKRAKAYLGGHGRL